MRVLYSTYDEIGIQHQVFCAAGSVWMVSAPPPYPGAAPYVASSYAPVPPPGAAPPPYNPSAPPQPTPPGFMYGPPQSNANAPVAAN